MPSLATVRNQTKQRLIEAGIDEADIDSRLLIAEALELSDLDLALNPDREISAQELEKLLLLVERRASRQPLSQIFEEKEFWSLRFKVTADTLTPRPDSETLIEAVQKHYKDKNEGLNILDLGTGTGCLLLSLLSEYPSSIGTGIDISQEALNIAKENAVNLTLADRATFFLGNWTEPLGKGQLFDIIISNPPYIGLIEKEDLAPEVKDHEPGIALFSGEYGLDDYQIIARQIGDYLKTDGCVVLEIGHKQAEAVKKIFTSAGFNKITLFKDLGARDRCLMIEKQ